MLILRDMRESDIEDYVRWFTADTEWLHWDAPWEDDEDISPEEARASWTEYYEAARQRPADEPRRKYEIDADGRHIGWICAYTDMDYFINAAQMPAIGIDIPDRDARGRGYGAEAMRQFMRILGEQGYAVAYTQTWSGNLPMLKLADKLGFEEVCCMPGMRVVNGQRYDAVTLGCRLPLQEDMD